MAQKKKRLLILDANSLIHRAFHALPPLSNSKGEMTNAVYGFLLALFRAIKEFEPDYIAAAFDHPAPTKREKKFKEYKAKREKAPDELYSQIPKIKEVLEALHIPAFETEGFEADDIIGTIARLALQRQAHPPLETVIVSGDMDTLQLVDKNTKVWGMRKGIQDTVLYDEKKVRERFEELDPGKIPDWKGLRGDPSDNIPGVAGVGEKTATQLLASFGSLDALYKALEQDKAGDVSERVKDKLLKEKEAAFFSRELATIDKSVPLDFRLAALAWRGFDRDKAEQALSNLEFRSLASRLSELEPGESDAAAEPQSREQEAREKIELLHKQGVLSDEIYELELKLSPVLRAMEEVGFQINPKHFNALERKVSGDLAKLEQKIAKDTGLAFNVSSPKQLSEALFEKLGISPRGLKKTAGGVISTASGELEKIRDAHPAVAKVLHYRELSKVLTTYIAPLPKLADKDRRIHTSFDQLGAATGRLSSSSPNLQNIPIQGELGEKVREGFVAPKGFQLVSFDYSQIELRIASHVAGEEKMQQFFQEDRDIHRETASTVFGVPDKEVTPNMRFRAKALNFGVLYGMGARGFAQSAQIPFEEAQDFIENYFAQFPAIAGYMEETIALAKEQGYVQTLFGRRRYLPDIHSRTPHLRAAAERMAVNMPIQGTSADLIKQAMVDIYEQYGRDRRIRMLLQIHDELLFEIRNDILHQTAPMVRGLMQQVASLRVPLQVDLKTGANWGELQRSEL